MSVQLKNVKVKFISILTDDLMPANGKEVIVKSKKGEDDNIEIFAKLEKFEKIKGLLYITPMVSSEKDTDDEYYVNETLEKTAHDTLKNAVKKDAGVDNPVDTNHINVQADDVYIVESYVNKTEAEWIWKACLDISENEELMQKAEDDKINGVSIAGTCTKVPDAKIKKFEQLIEKYANIEKDFNTVLEDMKNTDLYLPMDVFWRAAWDAYYDSNLDNDAFKKELKKIAKQFLKYVDSMTFEMITKNRKSEGEKMKDQEILDLVTKKVDEGLTDKLVTLKEDLIKELKPEIPSEPKADEEDEAVSKEQYEKLEKAFADFKKEVKDSIEEVKKSKVLEEEELKKELETHKAKVLEIEKALTDPDAIPADTPKTIKKQKKPVSAL